MYVTPEFKKTLQQDFLAAARAMDITRIRRLVRSGLIDITAADDKGNTALSFVCASLRTYKDCCLDDNEIYEIINLLASPEILFKSLCIKILLYLILL